jgi:hypothetical protein
LKILNSDSNDHVIAKDEILIIFEVEKKEKYILVHSEKNNRSEYVMKRDFIHLKQLKSVKVCNFSFKKLVAFELVLTKICVLPFPFNENVGGCQTHENFYKLD